MKSGHIVEVADIHIWCNRFAVAALIAAISVMPVHAAFGPCETTTPGDYRNTIACVSGGCTGGVIIIPEQKACADADESECTEFANNLQVDYAPKAVDQGFDAFAYCCGVDVSCRACAATLGLVCGYTGGSAYIACLVSVGCGSCALFTSCPYCCYTTCEQDLTSRIATPGGTNC